MAWGSANSASGRVGKVWNSLDSLCPNRDFSIGYGRPRGGKKIAWPLFRLDADAPASRAATQGKLCMASDRVMKGSIATFRLFRKLLLRTRLKEADQRVANAVGPGTPRRVQVAEAATSKIVADVLRLIAARTRGVSAAALDPRFRGVTNRRRPERWRGCSGLTCHPRESGGPENRRGSCETCFRRADVGPSRRRRWTPAFAGVTTGGRPERWRGDTLKLVGIIIPRKRSRQLSWRFRPPAVDIPSRARHKPAT